MKEMLMKECSSKKIYSGVYKIIFPNNKIYIGISNNIYRRMLEHNYDFRNNLPIENAIKKYGKITKFTLLEEIEPNNRVLMRERERYWILFYKSNKKEFGYNISKGGDGADSGSNNCQAKLSEEQYQEVYKDLLGNELSLQEIADKYQMNLSSISRLNNGHHYYHSDIVYPIRRKRPRVSGVNNKNSKFSENDIKNIWYLLQFQNDMTMKQIAKRYNVYPSVIQDVNLGKTYFNTELEYPLRNNYIGKRKLTDEQVFEIIKEIKSNPTESLSSIGRRLGLSSKTISSINCGTIYKQTNEVYPIRQTNKAVSTISASGE